MLDATDPEGSRLLRFLSLSPVTRQGVGSFARATRMQAMTAGLVAPNVTLRPTEPARSPWDTEPEDFRDEIAQGQPGCPLHLMLQIVSAEGRALPETRVDVHHANASGEGGALEAAESLRGVQLSDHRGIVSFRTIFPGRGDAGASEIRYRLFPGNATQVTGVIRLPEALSAYLQRSDTAYGSARRGTVARPAASAEVAFARVEEMPGGYFASLVICVDQAGSDWPLVLEAPEEDLPIASMTKPMGPAMSPLRDAARRPPLG